MTLCCIKEQIRGSLMPCALVWANQMIPAHTERYILPFLPWMCPLVRSQKWVVVSSPMNLSGVTLLSNLAPRCQCDGSRAWVMQPCGLWYLVLNLVWGWWQDLLSVRIKVSVWVDPTDCWLEKVVKWNKPQNEDDYDEEASTHPVLVVSPYCFHSFSIKAISHEVLLKSIYTFNYLSGECHGQGKLCYHNNESKLASTDF